MTRATLLLTLLIAPLSQAMEPMPKGPHGQPPLLPPTALYQASKQGGDPQATAAELTQLIPPAEKGKRYEVQVSVREVRELPTPPAQTLTKHQER